MKTFYLILFSAIFPSSILRSQSKTDSLNAALRNAKDDMEAASVYVALLDEYYISSPDTVVPLCYQALNIIGKALGRVNNAQKKALYGNQAEIWNHLALFYDNHGDTAKALDFYLKYLKISEETGNKKGVANAFNNLGYYYDNLGLTAKALNYYQQSLSIQEETGDKKEMAGTLNNIGMVYDNQGDVVKALDYYHRSLKIKETFNDRKGIAVSLMNIGTIYDIQGENQKALEFYRRGLQLQKDMGDKKNITFSLNNIGYSYMKQRLFDSALFYYRQGLAAGEESGNKMGMAYLYSNIGLINIGKGDLSKALECYGQSLKIRQEIGDKTGIAYSFADIGNVHYKSKNFILAESYFRQSLQIARELGFPEQIRNASQMLYEVYAATGNYRKALEMHVLFTQMSDSVMNDRTRKESIKKQFQYEYERKESAARAEQEKKDAIATAERKRQWLLMWFVVAVAIAVTVVAAVIFRSLRVTRKANRIITKQKMELQAQKKIVEEKNKDITDSIEYAKRIQVALLTSHEYIKQYLPDYFIVYFPRDIVSGDFYWALNKENYFFIAIADCTGHGIPGAFLSLLGMTFLNEIIIEKDVTSPDLVLNALRREITEHLNPAGSKEIKDGMDMTLCRFDLKNNILDFGSANRPLLHVRDGKTEKYTGDAMPVGVNQLGGEKPFTLQRIELKKGDIIYVFTDGISDQFGGPKGKKLSRKAVENLFFSVHGHPMEEQMATIEKTFNEWKGTGEQTDDVTVIGIRI